MNRSGSFWTPKRSFQPAAMPTSGSIWEARPRRVIALRNGFDRNNSIIDMNGLAATELDLDAECHELAD